MDLVVWRGSKLRIALLGRRVQVAQSASTEFGTLTIEPSRSSSSSNDSPCSRATALFMSSSRGTSQPVKIRTSSSGPATSSKLTVGSRVIICDDADLRGEISIGSGSVIHPKCVIHALSGPISIGSNCIIEELVTIINTSNEPMIIGDDNIFEVFSKVENVTVIGRGNTFEMKSQVMGYPSDEAGQAGELRIGDECTIAMGARLGPGMRGLGSTDSLEITQEALAKLLLLDEPQDDEQAAIEATAGASSFDLGPVAEEGEDETTPSVPPPPPKTRPSRTSAQDLTLLNRSVIFGALAHQIHQTQRSGESLGQERALHAKHLEYLRESEYRPGSLCKTINRALITRRSCSRLSSPALPRAHKLKVIV